MKRIPCPKLVLCDVLQSALPCDLGAKHQAPCHYDRSTYDAAVLARMRLYRRALEQIGDDERGHDCMSDDAHGVTTPCVRIAQEALAAEAGRER